MVAGSRTSNSRSPARILAVLVVFLLGTLAPTVIPVSAQSGLVQVETGPFFDVTGSATYQSCPGSVTTPALKAQPDDGLWQVRQVQVTNTGGTPLTEITFDYTIGPSPGTANKPPANMEIQWGGGTEGSKAAGWTVVQPANTATGAGAINQLKFTGSTLNAFQVFTVAFRVVGNPQADSLATLGAGSVSVTAGSTQVVGSGTSFSTFFQAGSMFRVSGDAHQYKVASIQDATHLTLTDKLVGTHWSPATGLNYTKVDYATPTTPYSFPVKVNNDATFCIIMDNTPPKVTSAYTRDTTYNGLLDEILLQFNEEMNPDSLVPSAFLVDASKSGEPVPYSVLPITTGSLQAGLGSDDGHFECRGATPPSNTCINLERALKLHLAEGYRYDTGITPEVTYPKPDSPATFADLAGNLLANITDGGITEVDGAKPVLVSVFDYEGATSMIATFSEPVVGTGPKTGATASDPDNCTGGTECVRTTDLYYYDRCFKFTAMGNTDPPGNCVAGSTSDMGGQNCIEASQGISPQIGVADHASGTATGHTVKLPIIVVPGDADSCHVSGQDFQRGKVGLGDADPTAGDVIALTKMASEPANCPGIDFHPCDALVRDATGLRGVPTATCDVANQCDAGWITPALHGATSSLPLVKEAVVNIDTFQVTLNFNGPVSAASGDANPITLQDLYVIAADGTGQGPAGITNILHRPGSSRAILTLDEKVRPTDVDDTPAKIGVKCNAIKGTRQQAFVPCPDPDLIGGPGARLLDNVLPAVLRAKTVDTDRNGQIDGVFVEFNEPVDDATFCQRANQMPPSECYPGSGGVDLRIGKYHNPGKTKYVFDTDAAPGGVGVQTISVDEGNGVANDRFGIIKIIDPLLQPAHLGTANPADTALTTEYAGLFSDLSHPGSPTSPPYLQAKQMEQICPLLCRGSVKLEDGAPPILLAAETVDTRPLLPGTTTRDVEGNGFLDGYRLTFSEPLLTTSFCHNNLQTGPTYLCSSKEWAVAGHNITGMRTRDPGTTTACPCNVITLLFQEGKTPDTGERPAIEYFGPPAGFPTRGLKDEQGNQMMKLKPADGFEQDRAAPVMVTVQGFLGRNELRIQFSEPVDNGNKGPIGRPHLQYYNIDNEAKGVSGFADQNAVQHTARTDFLVAQLNCPADGPPLTCGNVGITGHDVAKDTVAAELNAIWEVAPTVPIQQKKVVSTKAHALGNAIDIFRPDNVTDLKVIDAVTSANSISVSWTAPGNDGSGFGPVAGYIVKISTQKISPSDFDNALAPGSVGYGQSDGNATLHPEQQPFVFNLRTGEITAELSPDAHVLAGPGEYQLLTIVGLKSETTYHIAVKAFDNATLPCGYKAVGELGFQAPATPCPVTDTRVVNFRHVSGMRPLNVPLAAPQYDVSATTGKDATPPTPTPVIASTTHPANRPDPKMTAIFSWTNATDKESSTQYRFALNNEPQYQITATDNLYTGAANLPSVSVRVPETGTWYFHVAALSGGGQTATAHYTIIVGQTPIKPEDIAAANRYIKTNATRDDGIATVTWTLPPQALLPPGSNFQGIQIYRLENCGGSGTDCKSVLVHEVSGAYADLQAGSWEDNSTGASAANGYRVDMVFAQDQVQPAGSIERFAAVQDAPGRDNSALWWLLAVAVLLIAIAVVAFIIVRRNRAQAAAFEEIPPETTAAGIDPVSGMPAHDVRCPSCQTAFQAVGTLPLQITCPNCGVSGLLQ